jgi:hypothetical protein
LDVTHSPPSSLDIAGAFRAGWRGFVGNIVPFGVLLLVVGVLVTSAVTLIAAAHVLSAARRLAAAGRLTATPAPPTRYRDDVSSAAAARATTHPAR